MPVRRYLQRRIVAGETLYVRERWMLARLPGGAPVVLGLSAVVAVGVAVLQPDLGQLTVLSSAAVLALLAVALLSQASSILVALVAVPMALALPRDVLQVERTVAAVGLLLLIVGIPRAQRWMAVSMIDSPRGREASRTRLVIAAGGTVGLLVCLWGFVVPPMVRGTAIASSDDLVMSPLSVLALGALAACLTCLVALTVQHRAGVAPDIPLLVGPFVLDGPEIAAPGAASPGPGADVLADRLRAPFANLGEVVGPLLTVLSASSTAVDGVGSASSIAFDGVRPEPARREDEPERTAEPPG